MYIKKPFEKLSLIDDFMMNAVAGDPQIGTPFCRKLLSVLLGGDVGRIKVSVQRVVTPYTPELRGIRMDVEVEEFAQGMEEGLPALNIYDLEPHLRSQKNIAKHNRFYQAKIDGRYMRSGDNDFAALPNLYVLTITDFDPFQRGQMLYTIQNQCLELPDLVYDDGLKFLYFNTKGREGGSPEIKAMLDYIQNSTEQNAVNADIREIHRYVEQVKVLPEVKKAYMRFEDIIEYERKMAVEEVKKDAEERIRKADARAQQAEIRTTAENILELLKELGEVPAPVREKILAEKDREILSGWLKLAARADSLDAFVKNFNAGD